jgi:hypothetical protein
MGVQLDDVTLLGFLEILFTCDGRPGHQIIAVFSAELADTSLYARNEIAFVDNGVAWTARWVTRATFRSTPNPHGPPLYPDGLASLLDRAR